MFMDGKLEDKFLDRTVVGIPPVQSSSNFFLNAVLNVGGCSQIFELFRTVK